MNPIRSVDGRVTDIAEAPYIVSITFRSQHICSAALIQANIVLTAAHCFTSRIGKQVAILNNLLEFLDFQVKFSLACYDSYLYYDESV